MTTKYLGAYTNAYSSATMSMFVELINTGSLRPAVRHHSALPLQTVYVVLYIIASSLASEKICNLIMDEIISMNQDLDAETSPPMIRIIHNLCSPDEPPQALKEICLQYMANGDSEVLEGDLEREETREKVKPVAAELALMLVRKAKGRRDHLVVPSRENRCHFHVHKESVPFPECESKRIRSNG